MPKSLLTLYHLGVRDREVVQAYRDYHRRYQRAWTARRREAAVAVKDNGRRAHQARAIEQCVATAIADSIARMRQEIANERSQPSNTAPQGIVRAEEKEVEADAEEPKSGQVSRQIVGNVISP